MIVWVWVAGTKERSPIVVEDLDMMELGVSKGSFQGIVRTVSWGTEEFRDSRETWKVWGELTAIWTG